MKMSATPYSVARDLGLADGSIQRFGDFAVKIDHHLGRNSINAVSGSGPTLINVTAITPTPQGEGKTTVVIGLVDALRMRGKQAIGTIRQSSMGPTFNLKGAGVGGGQSQCVPRHPLILGLTGDFDRIAQAQNLGMTALTARSIHESMYDDGALAEKGLRRLGINSGKMTQRWTMDLCAQSLREIIMALDAKGARPSASSGFVMTSATEVMTIFSLAKNLRELRQMLGRMEFAENFGGQSITGDDLGVAGAMAVLLKSAFDPNLVLTQNGSPILMHGGPFANISIGNSTIVADLVAASVTDTIVTESGFGTDVGFEKMWNIKCRRSPLAPKIAVLVVTVRALKFLGKSAINAVHEIDTDQGELELVHSGFANLDRHLAILKMSGVTPIVCINRFADDREIEVQAVHKYCQSQGVRCASSEHFRLGGAGALALADLVIEASTQPGSGLQSFFADEVSVKAKIEAIVHRIYGIADVQYSEDFELRLAKEQNKNDLSKYHLCMCKTPYSFSHDPKKGMQNGDQPFQVTGIQFHHGAELVIPICGDASFMPGTVSKPMFKQIDLSFPGEDPVGI